MEHTLEKRYPVNPKDYKLYEEIGEGVSATVYRALCIPLNEIVAIKVLDLEKCNTDLDIIRREVQTMSLIDHPNLLWALCSFTTGHSLWIVMPYMAGGSCLHIMKSDYPEGFEEPIIATLLREVLKALVYLHAHGHIHRDVKAGNILIDSNGAVKLADFGVSACMFDGDRQHSRNTFVGTPCWMAPEVMQQLHGYDFKADIWSFGITALELAHGHAPFSKYPPMKVLLMTLQNAPPGLDYERDKRFSKSFKEMVAACLVKDPKKRPTSEKLLKHPFFKNARSSDYLARTILDGFAPLGERFRVLKTKEADLLVQKKALYEDKEQLSQQEYMRGISAWNFNLEDLKSQAALIHDYDDVPNAEDQDGSKKQSDRNGVLGLSAERVSSEMAGNSIAPSSREDGLNDLQDFESSLDSFPIKSLQALKGCFDIGEDDEGAKSPNLKGVNQSGSEPFIIKSLRAADQDASRNKGENSRQSGSLPRQVIPEHKKFLSGPIIPDNNFSPKKDTGDGDRDLPQPSFQSAHNYSGPLLYRQRRETNYSASEDASEGAVVRRGRFKVTSAELSTKGPTNFIFNPIPGGLISLPSLNPTVSAVLPSLQSILQQNTMQKEEIIRLVKYLEQSSGKLGDLTEVGINDLLQIAPSSSREKELQFQVLQLQQSVGNLSEELQRQKMKNVQLEEQLNALCTPYARRLLSWTLANFEMPLLESQSQILASSSRRNRRAILASSSSNRRRQFMDKQIMDLTSSSSSPPQDSSKDYIDLINHPQNEDIHNLASGFSAGNNWISNKEEIVPSYDFQPIRPVSASLDAPGDNNNPRSWSSIYSKIKKYGSLESLEPVKDIQEKNQKAVDTSLLAAIDQTMKKHTDNLMHMLEGVGARLTQLESRTSNLETSVDDLKVSLGNNHGSTDGKMRQLENILKEVQTEVHVVKEKQHSLEVLLQFPKLQVTKSDQPSETHSTADMDSVQQAASAPFQSHQQLHPAAAFPQSLSSAAPAPPLTVPSPVVPQQNLQPPVQNPDQFPQGQVPSVPQRDAYYPPPGHPQETPSQQFPVPPTQQVPSVPWQDAYYALPSQTQETPSQQFAMPPAQQPQPSPAAPPHQPYQPAPPPQYTQPPQPLQVQPPIGHHPEEASYVPSQIYPQNLRQPPSQPPSGPPAQQYLGTPPQMHEPSSRRPGPGFSSGYIPQSGPSDPYGYGGSSPQYGSNSPMKMPQLPSSTGSGYPHLPTARVLPQALPTASGVGGGPAPSGNKVPIDDVVDKVTSMGFPRDHVRATVRKLTENGQSVDLNVVLDKLMNDSDIHPPRGWLGR
ncbi:hypothetical protein GQ457_06G033910 [Hibiscus cannabinus]